MFSERRNTFRSPVVGTREGTLIVDREQLTVRVIDESAGGMSVASEIMPKFQTGAVGELRLEEGDIYRVEIKHVQPRGMCARIGLQRLETLQHSDKKLAEASPRRKRATTLKMAAFVVAGLTLGLAAQAEPVRKQLSKVPGLSKVFADPEAAPPLRGPLSMSIRQRLRDEFDIDLFAEPEISVILQLRVEQQSKIKTIIEAKNSVVRSNVPKSQQAAVLYITQMAMLGVLDTDQKYRLESLLEHTIGATDLLQKLVQQYWPTADAEELYKRLGAPAMALPQVAGKLNLDEKQLRSIRNIVDEALDKSESLYRESKPGSGDDAFLSQAYGYLGEAEERCLAVLTPAQRAIVEKMKN
jgi:hypothetical protein